MPPRRSCSGASMPPRPRFRSACSRRRSSGIGPAISARCRRTRCRYRRILLWPRLIDFHSRHARGERAQQLVADGAGAGGDFVRRQAFAPQDHRAADSAPAGFRSDPRTACPSTRGPRCACARPRPRPACCCRSTRAHGADSRRHSRRRPRRCAWSAAPRTCRHSRRGRQAWMSCTAMISLASVITGCRPSASALASANGEQP